MELQYMDHLAELVVNGETNWKQYGDVATQEQDGLILFNYTPKAQYDDRWNWFERVSRGLILNRGTGEVVARPFDKFFNYGEHGRVPAPGARLVRVCEKMDGSLGIRYVHQGEEHIATRGSMSSVQAQWATRWWREHNASRLALFESKGGVVGGNSLASGDYTLLFEIIYPENRVVVDYGDRAELVLLAARDRHNGEYVPYENLAAWAKWAGLSVAPARWFESPEAIVDAADTLLGAEGWVGEFSDGSRWKFKGLEYLQLHRLISALSFQSAVAALREGGEDRVNELALQLPEPYRSQFRQWAVEALSETGDIIAEVFRTIGEWDGMGLERKEFAFLVARAPARLRPYLFMVYDRKLISPAILAREFKGRRDRFLGGADA